MSSMPVLQMKGAGFSALREETDYYSRYSWCLDPFLTVNDLLNSIAIELEKLPRVVGWHREEALNNLYLDLCAVYCTASDFAIQRSVRVPGTTRDGGLANGLKIVGKIANMPAALALRGRTAKVSSLLAQVEKCIDHIGVELLEKRNAPFANFVSRVVSSFRKEAPAQLMKMRMQIPEAFRCQDLTFEDAAGMASNLDCALGNETRPVLILGLRTAGAYLAPLIAGSLRGRRKGPVNWITIRPKSRRSAREDKQLRTLLANKPIVVIVDDHPNTGRTMRLTLNTLRGLKVPNQDLIVLVPEHPARPAWNLPDEEKKGVRVVQMLEGHRQKVLLLKSSWLLNTVAGYVRGAGYDNVRCSYGRETAETNQTLESRYGDGFKVRLKRVVDVYATVNGLPLQFKVIAKSVGWGWLGYHAFLIASRLQGDVPGLLGLQKGFLFQEWVPGALPLSGQETGASLGRYIARRANALSLQRDPSFADAGQRWCVWDDLIASLRQVYGPRAGRLKRGAILRRLRLEATATPSLVDGSMKPQDFIASSKGLIKTDFEHHNFGGGELDVADPAYDLAVACYEFAFDSVSEKALVRTYQQHSGDADVERRLPVFKLIYGLNSLKASAFGLAHRTGQVTAAESSRLYCSSRRYLANCVASYLSLHVDNEPVAWTRRVLHLDVDGVLDWDYLGFPHTTKYGAKALQLLHRGGVSVVLNTARSLTSVQDYCRIFGLPGGFGELGSIFWDAVTGRAIAQIDDATRSEIETFRELIQADTKVLVDPDHHSSVRCFEFQDGRSRPLDEGKVRRVLESAGLTRLRFITSGADTWVGGAHVSKKSAVDTLHSLLTVEIEKTFAIGDTSNDVGMLESVDAAYAPSNASKEIRALVKRGGCRSTKSALQRGLLEAAIEIASLEFSSLDVLTSQQSKTDRLLDQLLAVPDQSTFSKWSALLRPGVIS